jgi:TPR repeat protein
MKEKVDENFRRSLISHTSWMEDGHFSDASAEDFISSAAARANAFKMAADAGDSDAMVQYGICLQSGNGVAVDASAAVRYYEMASQLENSEGQWRYGKCLELGLGIAADLDTAREYYYIAAEDGNAHGMYLLGRAQEGGWDGDDPSLYVDSYQNAARWGDPDGQLHYGRALEAGDHPDVEQAASYYQLAADQGNHEAQNLYGACLEEGKGVPVDLARALQYYRASAKGGDADGQRNYHRCLTQSDMDGTTALSGNFGSHSTARYGSR